MTELILLLQNVVVVERSGEVMNIEKSLVESNAKPVVAESNVGVGGVDQSCCRRSSVVGEQVSSSKYVLFDFYVFYGLEKS